MQKNEKYTKRPCADNCNMNKLCIKLILGHSTQDITDGVYTHKNLKDLLEAVNLLQ